MHIVACGQGAVIIDTYRAVVLVRLNGQKQPPMTHVCVKVKYHGPCVPVDLVVFFSEFSVYVNL